MSKTNYDNVKAWRRKNRVKVTAQYQRRYAKHKEKIKTYQKSWRLKNLERQRLKEAEYAREYRARKTEQQKVRMQRYRAKQEAVLVSLAGRPRQSVCELCRLSAKTVFDHDHATGKFRGWLCDRCNRTLGQVKDNVPLLLEMVQYLTVGGFGHGKIVNRDEKISAVEHIRVSKTA